VSTITVPSAVRKTAETAQHKQIVTNPLDLNRIELNVYGTAYANHYQHNDDQSDLEESHIFPV